MTRSDPDPESLAPPAGVFVLARLDGVPVGCGGFRRFADGVAEIKRMYVAPEARRRGVATALLADLEAHARALDYRSIRLETGTNQPEAMALYQRAGYRADGAVRALPRVADEPLLREGSPSMSTPTADRDLFLHEYIDINGMHQWDYMEHTRQQSGDEKVDFELLGTWYTMGITARWPQVVNIWEIPGGWDGWYGKVDRLGLKRATNVTLNAWWKQAFEYRSGGFDRLLAAARAARPSRRSPPTTCGARCSCTS